MLILTSIPRPNPEIIARRLETESVLVMPIKGKIKVLNDVGARVWDLVDGTRSIEDICATISQEYNISVEIARHDVQSFLKQLGDRGMVTFE